MICWPSFMLSVLFALDNYFGVAPINRSDRLPKHVFSCRMAGREMWNMWMASGSQ